MGAADTLEVRLVSITYEAQGINSYELRPIGERELPPFSAGAHIDLHLPNGLVRSYSLVNSQNERHRYVIAVNLGSPSRGGSRYMHDSVRVGDRIAIGAPRNNFQLAETASRTVLIAGGIGITPLWCMIQRLEELGRAWTLHYSTRTRQRAAFLDRLAALTHRQFDVHLNFDQEPGGKMIDIQSIVEQAPPEAHLYCCGPLPMLAAFERAATSRPAARVHVEYFAAKEPPAAGGFTVVLARAGRSVLVPPGKSILDALLEQGISLAYSCREGVCGTCETSVIEGIPDHRDLVLTRAERAAGKTMMVCCSGCKGDTLVLDL